VKGVNGEKKPSADRRTGGIRHCRLGYHRFQCFARRRFRWCLLLQQGFRLDISRFGIHCYRQYWYDRVGQVRSGRQFAGHFGIYWYIYVVRFFKGIIL